MIFPWDSEIHQCIECEDITFFDGLEGDRDVRISASYVPSGWENCNYAFHIVAQDEMEQFRSPTFHDFIGVAPKFKDYYQ